ncbi:hypothetical protein [Nonomuraea fuscirosea]|uniref:hypothetical protein n=1 Tax=Nonomuraea fuscirosea TaxID=1291556 RepID=UPI0033E1C83B
MSRPQPTRVHHDSFCRIEGWRQVNCPPEALPADLVFMLISRAGLDEMTVAAMSKDEAVARLQKYWIDGT